MSPLPIYKTLTFKVAMALIVLFVLNGTLLVLWDQADILHDMELDMQLTYAGTGREIADILEPVKADPRMVSAFLDSLADYYPGMEIFHVSEEGQVLHMSGYIPSTLIRDQVNTDRLEAFITADETAYPLDIEIPTSSDLDFVFSAARLDNDYILVTLLEGGEDIHVSWWEEYGAILSRAAMVSFIVAVIAGLLFWYFLTRRIDKVATAVQTYRTGNNGIDLSDQIDDEIGRVTRHVGDMMGRIDSMFSELANKEKMRTELLATVSHELQTPLTVMHGNIETLVEHRERLNENELSDKLGTIYGQIQHMSELIDDLADVAILDTGQMKINKEPFIIEELIEDVRSSFAVMIERSKLQIECHYTDSPQPVFADPLRLRQVIRNLVSNAIKYSEPNGRIDITTNYEPNRLVFTIADTGTGISEEDIENIFDSFYRSENHIQRSVKGTGLGLNICQQILQLHDSTLTVESIPREGSTFTFHLQLYQEPGTI